MTRRSFFAKLAGAVVAARVVPSTIAPVYGYSGGAHIGSIVGGFNSTPRLLSTGEGAPEIVGTFTPQQLERLRQAIDRHYLRPSIGASHGHSP